MTPSMDRLWIGELEIGFWMLDERALATSKRAPSLETKERGCSHPDAHGE